MEDLETSLKSINSTGDQWWEEALGCIQKKVTTMYIDSGAPQPRRGHVEPV